MKRYLSGSPWKKTYNKAALWDLRCFLRHKERYKHGKNGADHHTWHNEYGFDDYNLESTSYFNEYMYVPMSWKKLQLCFYGKGTPHDFKQALMIVDFYLYFADMRLSSVHWTRRMTLDEYAYYYLGLDCNGFTGAYLKTFHPGLGIGPNDHINNLDSKLKKRTDIHDVRMGDILSREGAGGTRHVAMIDTAVPNPFADDTIAVSVTQSAGSLDGLKTQWYTLKFRPKKTLKWKLAGYYEFHHCLAPEQK